MVKALPGMAQRLALSVVLLHLRQAAVRRHPALWGRQALQVAQALQVPAGQGPALVRQALLVEQGPAVALVLREARTLLAERAQARLGLRAIKRRAALAPRAVLPRPGGHPLPLWLKARTVLRPLALRIS